MSRKLGPLLIFPSGAQRGWAAAAKAHAIDCLASLLLLDPARSRSSLNELALAGWAIRLSLVMLPDLLDQFERPSDDADNRTALTSGLG